MSLCAVLLGAALACTALAQVDIHECQVSEIKRGESPGKFVVCVEEEGELLYVENECSQGLVFDLERKRCTRLRPKAMFLSISDSAIDPGMTTSPTTTADSLTTVPTPTKRPCKGPGAYCSDCNTLSFCVQYGLSRGPVLRSILDLPCGTDSVCVTRQGCVKIKTGGLCREGPFVCGDVGLYPDLYDCTVFHSCSISLLGELIDTPISCSGGLLGNRWDPITSTCGWPENVEFCQKTPVPQCTKPLEMRAVGGQIYSICIEDPVNHTVAPRLFRCPAASVFNATSYSCENP